MDHHRPRLLTTCTSFAFFTFDHPFVTLSPVSHFVMLNILFVILHSPTYACRGFIMLSFLNRVNLSDLLSSIPLSCPNTSIEKEYP